MDDVDLIQKLDERISFWNRKFETEEMQMRADAFIEAFELVKEWVSV